MNLLDINKRLEELLKLLPEALIKFREIEITYDRRYWELYLHSGMGTVGAKEYETKSVLDQEGLYEKVVVARTELKNLLGEQDMLFEMSRNLRTITGKEVRKSEI